VTRRKPTLLWNRCASIQELTVLDGHGGVRGRVTGVIVLGVLKSELALEEPDEALVKEVPTRTRMKIAWKWCGRFRLREGGLC